MPGKLKLEILLKSTFGLLQDLTALGALLWLCQPVKHTGK